MLNKNSDNIESVTIEDVEDVDDAINNDNRLTRCNKCSLTSSNHSQLAGHMIKHTGQYTCGLCKQVFQNCI